MADTDDEGTMIGPAGGPWMRIPHGWTARTARHGAGPALARLTVVRAGNFVVPPIESPDGREATEEMEAGAVLVTVVVADQRAHRDIVPLRRPPRVRRADFGGPRRAWQACAAVAVLRGQLGGRLATVQVALGPGDARAGGRRQRGLPSGAEDLIAQANAVLATLAFGR